MLQIIKTDRRYPSAPITSAS